MAAPSRLMLAALGFPVLLACARVLGLEDSVAYAPDEAVVFPTCASAAKRLFCEDEPSSRSWLNANRSQLPDGGNRCRQQPAAGLSGGGLLVSSNPAIAPAGVDGWCGITYFTYLDGGFRARIAFRIQSDPLRQRFGILGFFLTNLSFLVVEAFEGTLRARPSNRSGIVELDPALATIGAIDDKWHELAVHVTAGGTMNVVFDGKLRASPLELDPLIPGLLQVAVLDSTRADVNVSVTIEDVIAIPY